jgi:hypothetical protein
VVSFPGGRSRNSAHEAAVRPPARYKEAFSPNRKRRLRIMPVIVKKIYTLMAGGLSQTRC